MTNQSNTPKAFVSHASEDKDRFVIPFATYLRSLGIDAWLDKWEINLGDSLVQKIFDDGLGKADAAIIVLSPVSITKPWVREEIDSAFVAKVENRIRLIPVVLENCDVPTALRHIAYTKVPNPNEFQNAADEIARVLFNRNSKPALGSPPVYARASEIQIPGLEKADILVLLAIGNAFLQGRRGVVPRDAIEKELVPLGLTSPAIQESLEILTSKHMVEGKHVVGQEFAMIGLTLSGADVAYRKLVEGYEDVEALVAGYIVNAARCDGQKIAEALALPYAVVEHTLDKLTARGLIDARKLPGSMLVISVSAELKRAMRG